MKYIRDLTTEESSGLQRHHSIIEVVQDQKTMHGLPEMFIGHRQMIVNLEEQASQPEIS